jgi:RNA polymerase sigma-70 factor (ECF subfamily)
MDEKERLSRISTVWTDLHRAHGGALDDSSQARHRVLARYQGAVYRYLLGATRDPDQASELFQEFAVRFLRGDFRRADAERGRFRDYLKTALVRLVSDARKTRARQAHHVVADPDGLSAPEVNTPFVEEDAEFLRNWRNQLLARAWDALQERQARSGQPYYDVLRLRSEAPELTSPQLAERLEARWGRPVTPSHVRQLVHRARETFAGLLLTEVIESLESPSPDEVENELVELNLLRYCRSALAHPRDL